MFEPAPAEIPFRAGHSDLAPGCTDLACTAAEAVVDPRAVLAAAVVSVTAVLAFAYLRDAREVCLDERERTATEAAAFGEFADRVSSIEGGDAGFVAAGATGTMVGSRRDARLDRVRDAYRETVMDVPHYEEEYGDSIPRSMAEEFGADVAAAVCHGDALTPHLQSTVVGRAAAAEARREELLDAVATELDALGDAGEDLERLDRERDSLARHLEGGDRFDTRVDVWRRLDDLESRTESVVSDRQAFLQDSPMSASDDIPSFHEYLYTPLEVTYPVLAAGADLVARIREDRDRVYRELTAAD